MSRKLCWFLFIVSYHNISILGEVQENSRYIEPVNYYFRTKYIQDSSVQDRNQLLRNVGKSNNGFFVKKRMKRGAIRKRGIVLVDEDFEVPPGVMKSAQTDPAQGYKEQFRKEKNLKTDGRKMFDEGSGVGSISEENSKKTDLMKTAQTRVFNFFDELMSDPTISTRIMETEVSSRKLDDTGSKINLIEGSGGDEILTFSTDLIQTTDLTPKSGGDDILTSSTDLTQTTDATQKSLKTLNDSMLMVCMESACNSSSELLIKSSYEGPIQEGANLTFECVSSNYSNVDLYWYKDNGDSLTLETFENRSYLEFNMAGAKFLDSGIYRCVKVRSDGSCCFKEIHLNVYQAPPYKYHLLTIGIVAAACLVTCILVGLWRNWKIAHYTKPFIEKNAQQTLLS